MCKQVADILVFVMAGNLICKTSVISLMPICQCVLCIVLAALSVNCLEYVSLKDFVSHNHTLIVAVNMAPEVAGCK